MHCVDGILEGVGLMAGPFEFVLLKDKTCWFCGDFPACWYEKINIEVGRFIVGA